MKALKQFIASLIRKSYDVFARVAPITADRSRTWVYRGCHKVRDMRCKIPPSCIREHPAVLVDVTQTEILDVGTGIQRVVRSLLAELTRRDNNVLPVREADGKLLFRDGDYAVPILPGDKLLLLDSSWSYHHEFKKIIACAHAQGAQVYATVYDLFPIRYPQMFDSRWFSDTFRAWHNLVLQEADAVLCISKTTADSVETYYRQQRFSRKSPLLLYDFPMGAELKKVRGNIREGLRSFVQQATTFLMVGTVEPRKGHATAMKAFVKLLRKGKVQLLILGRNGWKNKEFYNFLQTNENLQNHVLWIKDATDAELCWAYDNTDALIAASKDEGFGLPLIEAARFGLPIICSDIPIFREVTQGHADYFKAMDADSLAACISSWLREEKHPDSRKIHIYTWQEAAKEILDIMDGKVEPYRVLE